MTGTRPFSGAILPITPTKGCIVATISENAREKLLALDFRTIKNVRICDGTVQVITQSGPMIFQFPDQHSAEAAFDDWVRNRQGN
jgi:hypothetical protein